MASKAPIFLLVNLLFFTLLRGNCGSAIAPTPGTGNGGNNGGGGGGSPTCPRDALKLGVCADILGGLVNVTVGTPPTRPCCSLIGGLVDLEAAVCLCTAIKAGVLGIINVELQVALTLLLNACGNSIPAGFICSR